MRRPLAASVFPAGIATSLPRPVDRQARSAYRWGVGPSTRPAERRLRPPVACAWTQAHGPRVSRRGKHVVQGRASNATASTPVSDWRDDEAANQTRFRDINESIVMDI